MSILKGEIPAKGGYFGYKAPNLLWVTGVAYGRDDIESPRGKRVGFRAWRSVFVAQEGQVWG